jgi:hypothetical protein
VIEISRTAAVPLGRVGRKWISGVDVYVAVHNSWHHLPCSSNML